LFGHPLTSVDRTYIAILRSTSKSRKASPVTAQIR
jgi:hypothetical protein